MFHKLHRLVVWGWWSLVVAAVWLLYCKRAALRPLADRVEALEQIRLDPNARQPIGHLGGTVFAISGPDSFWLRDGAGADYHLRLAGVRGVSRGHSRHSPALWEAGVTHLTHLLLSNRVEVALTYTNEYRLGLAIVSQGTTNVNRELVAEGWARLNLGQLRAFPVRDQYEMFRAEQAARGRRIGLWR